MAAPASDAQEAPSKTSPRTGSPWPKRLGLAALIAVVGGVGGLLVLSRALDSERVASWLEPRVSRAVNRPVTLDGARVGIFPLRVRLQGLEIADPTGLTPALASLDEIDLRVRALPLIRRQVVVKEIRLEGLEARLRVDADGTSNFGDFSPAPDGGLDTPPTEVEQEGAAAPDTGGTADADASPAQPRTDAGANPFALSLDNIQLSNWSLSYENLADSVHLAVREFGGRAAVRRDGGTWDFQADVAGEALAGGVGGPERLSDGVPLELEAALSVPDDFASLLLESGELRLDAVRLALSGRIDQLRAPVRQVELAVRGEGLALADVIAALPQPREAPGLGGTGTLDLALEVAGEVGPGHTPSLEGQVSLRDGALALGGDPVASELQVRMDIQPDGTARPVVDGTILGGASHVAGLLRWQDGLELDLAGQVSPDLSLIPAAFLPPGVSLAGTVPSDLRMAGSMEDLTGLGFWGTAGVRDLRVDHPASGLPVSIAAADLTLNGGQATLPASEVRLGTDPFRVQGTFSGFLDALEGELPRFMGSASGPRLDLVAVVPDPPADTSLTWGRVAFANVGGRTVRGLSAADAARQMGLERPVGLPFQGELGLAVDTVLDRRGRMEDLRATVLFSPDLVQLTDATFRRYGGRIAASGSLELGEDAEEPFSLRLRASGVDAGRFLSETTPLGRTVQGTLDLDVDLTGALDALLLPSRSTLQGAGRFALTGGGLELGALGGRLADFLGLQALANPRVRDWRSGFILRDGRIVLDEAALQGAPGDPRVGGGVGLDGGLDLVTAFDLPREDLAAAAVSRLGLPESIAGQDLVSAVLRVGGTLTDPAVRADPGAAAQSVSTAVEEEARARINQEIQEQRENLQDRATSALRGLLGGRRAPPPPPDTMAPQTVDSVQATPPDTTGGTPPDTTTGVPPDTTRTSPPDTTRATPPDTTRATPPDTMRTTPPDAARSSARLPLSP